MQSQRTNSRESAFTQTMEIGKKIYERYGQSPGLIALERGSGLTGKVLLFSDRLPLLQALHERWNTDGGPFGRLTANAFWLRALAQAGKPQRSTPTPRSITIH